MGLDCIHLCHTTILLSSLYMMCCALRGLKGAACALFPGLRGGGCGDDLRRLVVVVMREAGVATEGVPPSQKRPRPASRARPSQGGPDVNQRKAGSFLNNNNYPRAMQAVCVSSSAGQRASKLMS